MCLLWTSATEPLPPTRVVAPPMPGDRSPDAEKSTDQYARASGGSLDCACASPTRSALAKLSAAIAWACTCHLQRHGRCEGATKWLSQPALDELMAVLEQVRQTAIAA